MNGSILYAYLSDDTSIPRPLYQQKVINVWLWLTRVQDCRSLESWGAYLNQGADYTHQINSPPPDFQAFLRPW